MSELPMIQIRPTKGWAALNLRDLWLYRELIYFLTWRDIKVRYKQAVLGIAWAILQPLLTMVIFSFIFGNLAKLPSDGIPYPLFSYAAVLPWQLFSSALHRSSVSLVGNANLLTKIYFPRLIIPFSAVMASLVDFGIAFLVMIGLMIYYQVWPTLMMLWIIPLTLLALLTALAVSLWLSALNVLYRDVQHMIPFLTQFWMYASPVAYSAESYPDRNLAHHLWPESNGRGHSGIPLGVIGCPTAGYPVGNIHCNRVASSGIGFVLFPAHGKDLCGQGVKHE